MITALTGNNSFLLKQKLDKLVTEFVAQYGELALERIDGEEASGQDIIDTIQSLPFLASRKLVVVRSLSANKAAAESIEQIISSISDSTDLIFYEPLTDRRTVFYKTLKSKTEFEELTELDPRGLAQWLMQEAKNKGSELSLLDANYLVERVGANQILLANELDKLTIYDSKMTKASIDLLTEKAPQSKVFDLLDAAFAGNKDRALKLYSEQRAQKVEPQAILAMLVWQLNILAAIALAGSKNSGEIAKDLGMSPFPVSKAVNLAKKLGQNNITKLVNEAEKIDRLGKTKPIDLDEALKTYIATI